MDRANRQVGGRPSTLTCPAVTQQWAETAHHFTVSPPTHLLSPVFESVSWVLEEEEDPLTDWSLWPTTLHWPTQSALLTLSCSWSQKGWALLPCGRSCAWTFKMLLKCKYILSEAQPEWCSFIHFCIVILHRSVWSVIIVTISFQLNSHSFIFGA